MHPMRYQAVRACSESMRKDVKGTSRVCRRHEEDKVKGCLVNPSHLVVEEEGREQNCEREDLGAVLPSLICEGNVNTQSCDQEHEDKSINRRGE